MPTASIMASQEKTDAEPGAPVAKDAIDPDLIKLKRARPKIGVITAAGLVFLCAYFLLRLNPDRRFSGADAKPGAVTVGEVLSGNIALDRYVSVEVEPLMAHAIRTTTAKGSLGLRVVPARGTGDKLWLVLSGDGWEPPAQRAYVGRLRKLGDLAFAPSLDEFADTNPRPVFATAEAVRAGLATGKITAVTGDEVAPRDRDRIAFDVEEPGVARIVATINERLNADGWAAALAKAGIQTKPGVGGTEQVRFDVELPVADVQAKLETANKEQDAKLWAARVEPITHHVEKTWAELREQPLPPGVDLVGIYVGRGIPGDAYALITGEKPEDYWYVLPVTIALALIGLTFAWALVRAVKRDLLPTRA